jgi:hypothetical protein
VFVLAQQLHSALALLVQQLLWDMETTADVATTLTLETQVSTYLEAVKKVATLAATQMTTLAITLAI